MTFVRRLWAPAAVILVAVLLLVWHLGTAPLQDYDEATFAQIIHEELADGHWIFLTYREQPYLEKPPLYFWAAGASAKLLGESPLSLRLPSALAGIALVGLSMALAYELGASILGAALAGAILLTIGGFVDAARQIRVDTLVSLWIILATYGFVRGLRQPRWLLLFGPALALATMTKSIIAVLGLIAVLSFALWVWRFDWLREKYFWIGAGLGALIVLPWHIAETLRYGSIFWQEYLGYNVGDRFSHNLFAAPSSTVQYVWYLAQFAAPWTQLVVVGVVAAAIYWRGFSNRRARSAWACATTAATIFGIFSFASTKAPTYLVPLYPFAATALALGISEVISKLRGATRSIALATATLSVGLGLCFCVYNGFHYSPYFAQSDELAREEKAAATIVAQNSAATWYSYRDTDVGAIMYYTQRLNPLALSAAVPPGGILLLYNTDTTNLASQYPSLQTAVLFRGNQLTLLRVL